MNINFWDIFNRIINFLGFRERWLKFLVKQYEANDVRDMQFISIGWKVIRFKEKIPTREELLDILNQVISDEERKVFVY